MTRFARAKGSKASNEKRPEDGTPWEVMKEQLLEAKKDSEEAKKREEAENQRIKNYEKFLKEQKVQKRKATWCDFPETENNNSVTPHNDLPKSKKNKKKQKPVIEDTQVKVSVEDGDAVQDSIKKTKKAKKKNNKQTPLVSSEIQTKQSMENHLTSTEDNIQSKNKNKKNKQKVKMSQSDNSVGEIKGTNSEKLVPFISNSNNNDDKRGITKVKESKMKKLINGQPVRRKALNDNSFQLIINGKEVELVRFDGFPIMKKDAERLTELKTNMIKKGIPKSEVQRTMKLERRRAEKALARVKRDVCYNCRKGGHNLSDCPDLKSKIPGADSAEGVCFKCGSTEHRQFECKVQRDKEFRFATCFICKEQGHIARQCPDNPKGLYPNGGSCKLCGDVTHLRKDCPTVNDKKEETSVKLQTLDSSENIEDIQPKHKSTASEEVSKKPKKITF